MIYEYNTPPMRFCTSEPLINFIKEFKYGFIVAPRIFNYTKRAYCCGMYVVQGLLNGCSNPNKLMFSDDAEFFRKRFEDKLFTLHYKVCIPDSRPKPEISIFKNEGLFMPDLRSAIRNAILHVIARELFDTFLPRLQELISSYNKWMEVTTVIDSGDWLIHGSTSLVYNYQVDEVFNYIQRAIAVPKREVKRGLLYRLTHNIFPKLQYISVYDLLRSPYESAQVCIDTFTEKKRNTTNIEMYKWYEEKVLPFFYQLQNQAKNIDDILSNEISYMTLEQEIFIPDKENKL